MAAVKADTFDTGSKWTQALLDLFWDVDEAVKAATALEGEDVPEGISQSYERAEAARQAMVESSKV